MSILGMLGGQALGKIFGIGEDRRQLEQQRKMMELQIQGSKEMGKFNKELQMELWRDTNYHAQVEQMKKAGLNVGMMYGGGGSGGNESIGWRFSRCK